jgi:four helix bundle protein
MQGHKELIVWQKAMHLVVAVYKLTKCFPKTEIYGLASQIQRAAVSVPSNIAEGHALKQTQAYTRHLAIANGSLAELETQLDIANRLGYLKPREPTGYRPGFRGGENVMGFTAKLAVPARRC